MNKKKSLAFIIINLFIFITTCTAVPVTLIFGSRAGRLDNLGFPFWQHAITFTVLSNIFLALVAFAATIIAIRARIKHQSLPNAIVKWYLAAASSAMLTCVTVVFFLAPARAISGKNYFDMLLEPMFFLHFLNPILSALTISLFTPACRLGLRPRLLAMIPMVLYAIVYVTCVIFLKIWPDFYSLTFGGRYYLTPIVFAVFCLALFGISSLLAFFHNRNLE